MRLAPALAALTLSVQPLAAGDSTGGFAVDGIGARNCSDFTAALTADDRSIAAAFVGWTDGFLSGMNALSPDTFDLTPWQTAEIVIAKMNSFCTANPDEPYVNGLGRLVSLLRPDRLPDKDEVVEASWDGKSLLVYRTMLGKIRVQLSHHDISVSTPDGAFDDAFAKALIEAQKKAGIAETGLPDQRTLVYLFEGS